MIPAPITTQSGSNLRSNVPNIFTLRTGPDVGSSDNTSSPHDNTVINSLLKLTSLKCENGFKLFLLLEQELYLANWVSASADRK